jgi:hypothetical protein
MPDYSIRLTNSEFQSQDDPRPYDSLDDAVKSAVDSAVVIVRELLNKTGEKSATVEAVVFEGDEVVARRIISISALVPGDDQST